VRNNRRWYVGRVCVGPSAAKPFASEVKHFEVDAAHVVAVTVDSLTASTNEKHQFIVEIAK
jgi:hypothetical protein